ncbi:ATPase, AAA family protein [Toxoplasma gondii RUB]|uniref:ATPase, AAA family protein n=1 Tax=Toxoplasma gondii RUB TaxID=935652 RepID=A0A086LMT7_TOXGO|nr:ATPase, AAA family protein [Toxoplasma gondii RUB]
MGHQSAPNSSYPTGRHLYVEVFDQSTGMWSKLRTCCFGAQPNCDCPLKTRANENQGRLLGDAVRAAKPQTPSRSVKHASTGGGDEGREGLGAGSCSLGCQPVKYISDLDWALRNGISIEAARWHVPRPRVAHQEKEISPPSSHDTTPCGPRQNIDDRCYGNVTEETGLVSFRWQQALSATAASPQFLSRSLALRLVMLQQLKRRWQLALPHCCHAGRVAVVSDLLSIIRDFCLLCSERDISSVLEGPEKNSEPACDNHHEFAGPPLQSWWLRKLRPVRGVTVEGVPGAGKRQLCRSIAAHAPWLRRSAATASQIVRPHSKITIRPETFTSCPAGGDRDTPVPGLYEIDLREYISCESPVLATECLDSTTGGPIVWKGAGHTECATRRFRESGSGRKSPSASLEAVLARITEEARIRRSLFRLWLLQNMRESSMCSGFVRPTAGSNADTHLAAATGATDICADDIECESLSPTRCHSTRGSKSSACPSVTHLWDIAAGGGCCFFLIRNLELIRATGTGTSVGDPSASADHETRKNIAPHTAALIMETLCRFISLWEEENLRVFMMAPLDPGAAVRLSISKRSNKAWQVEGSVDAHLLSLDQLFPRELLGPGFFERRICLPETLDEKERAAILRLHLTRACAAARVGRLPRRSTANETQVERSNQHFSLVTTVSKGLAGGSCTRDTRIEKDECRHEELATPASEWTAGYQPEDLRALVRAAAHASFHVAVRSALSSNVSAPALVQDLSLEVPQHEAAGNDAGKGIVPKRPCDLFTLDNFRIALLGAGGGLIARITSGLHVVPHTPDPPSGKGGSVSFSGVACGDRHRVIPLSEDRADIPTGGSSRLDEHRGRVHPNTRWATEGIAARVNLDARLDDTIKTSGTEERDQQGSVRDAADVEPFWNRSYRVVRGFSGIVGEDALISRLRRQVIEPVFTGSVLHKNGAIHRTIRKTVPVGVLITGDPGTGKSLLAAAIAYELRSTLLVVSPAELLRATLGSADKQLMRVFDVAEKAAPCVLLIEDIDRLAPANGKSCERKPHAHLVDSDYDASVGSDLSRADSWEKLPRRGGRGACGGRLLHTLLLRLDLLGRRRQFGRQTAGNVAGAAGVLVIGTADREMSVDPRLFAPYRLRYRYVTKAAAQWTYADARDILRLYLRGRFRPSRPSDSTVDAIVEVLRQVRRLSSGEASTSGPGEEQNRKMNHWVDDADFCGEIPAFWVLLTQEAAVCAVERHILAQAQLGCSGVGRDRPRKADDTCSGYTPGLVEHERHTGTSMLLRDTASSGSWIQPNDLIAALHRLTATR